MMRGYYPNQLKERGEEAMKGVKAVSILFIFEIGRAHV
jgi:hypothetical protein